MKVVIINCFDTYQHRVDLLSSYFCDIGWNVTKICSDFSHRTKSYISQPMEGCVYLPVRPYQKNLSATRMCSHHAFAKACKQWLDRQAVKPDLLWVLLPPNSLSSECAKYKSEHSGVKLIFDLIDLWPETFPIGGVKWLPPFYLWRQMRDKYLPRADHIVTECMLYQQRLRLSHNRATTLYMCRPHESRINSSKPELPNRGISLCYLGSINHIIDIDAISTLITQLKKTQPVMLHIIGDGERLEQMMDAAGEAGAELINHGTVFDNAEKQRIFDQCHFGLNIMKASVCVGMTMKSVDYLAGGLPLLNTIPGDTWDLVERYHAGLNWRVGDELHFSNIDHIQMRDNARKLFELELAADCLKRRIGEIIKQVGL